MRFFAEVVVCLLKNGTSTPAATALMLIESFQTKRANSIISRHPKVHTIGGRCAVIVAGGTLERLLNSRSVGARGRKDGKWKPTFESFVVSAAVRYYAWGLICGRLETFITVFNLLYLLSLFLTIALREREREKAKMENAVGRTRRRGEPKFVIFSRPADDTIHPKWDSLQTMIIKSIKKNKEKSSWGNERIRWKNFFFPFIHLNFFIFVNRQLSCHLFHLHKFFFLARCFLSALTDLPTVRSFPLSPAWIPPVIIIIIII